MLPFFAPAVIFVAVCLALVYLAAYFTEHMK